MMVDLGEERGTINSDEGEWIDNVFEFGETTVREVMTHVSEVVAVPSDATRGEITKVIRESGRSRIPSTSKTWTTSSASSTRANSCSRRRGRRQAA